MTVTRTIFYKLLIIHDQSVLHFNRIFAIRYLSRFPGSQNLISMATKEISADFPFTLHRVKVLDAEMAYIDTASQQLISQTPTILIVLPLRTSGAT